MYTNIPGFAIPGLRYLISTRDEGVSEGGFRSLNLAYHVGDDARAVTENRRRLARAAGYAAEDIICAQQVHGARLAWVTGEQRGSGAFSWESAIAECDGLLLHDTATPVGIQVADCAPVLIVDATRRLLAIVHAGWRGAVAGIVSRAIHALRAAGSDPAAMQLGVGPTLCTDCLEVSPEIGAAVPPRFGNAVVCRPFVKPHLNLRAIIAEDAIKSGVAADRITIHPACTCCQVSQFFSHRGQQGYAGRFAMIAWWESANILNR